MKVINARNINDAWDMAKILLNADHITRPSRVGEVWEHPTAVATVYSNPAERVLFNSERNANPIFHLMESLWCLAGRNDIAWLELFNSKIRNFVGQSPIQHGAYGHRWRFAFDLDGGAEDGYADQLQKIIRMLKKSPDERRAVLTMWNPLWDLERPDLSDVPCNLIVTFKIRQGKLAMIVFCRSNDIAYGCYGSNVVQFSMLQEYVASMIGVPMGTYTQVSDSWHAYTERWASVGGLDPTPSKDYYFSLQYAETYPLVHNPETFDEELKVWMDREWENGENDFPGFYFKNYFFPEVAEVLWQTWSAYKQNNFTAADATLSLCNATDWRIATKKWLHQIISKREQRGVTA